VTSLLIDGVVGQLEADLDLVDDGSDIAVLCHPHPQYGGSMYDNVLSMLAAGFKRSGVSTLRFNFRGVGASGGVYDDGQGEIDDVLAVLNWCSDQYQQSNQYICGYSFGAVMALKALARLRDRSRAVGSVLVAPPVQMLTDEPTLDYRMLIILGEDDSIVSSDSVSALFPSESIRSLPGTDHFFMGVQQQVIQLTEEFVSGT